MSTECWLSVLWRRGGGLIEKKRRKIPAVNGDRGEVQLPSEYDSKRGRRKIYTMNDSFFAQMQQNFRRPNSSLSVQ